jgi:hypothetical protein
VALCTRYYHAIFPTRYYSGFFNLFNPFLFSSFTKATNVKNQMFEVELIQIILNLSFKDFQLILNPKSRSRDLAKSKNRFIYAIQILILLFSIGLYFLFGESLRSSFDDESEVKEESPEEIKEELSFLRQGFTNLQQTFKTFKLACG